MRHVLGVFFFLAGAIAAIYVGVIVCAIGGIENAVNGAKAHPTDGAQILWGLVEAGILSWLAGLVLFYLGIWTAQGCFEAAAAAKRSRHGGLSNRQIRMDWQQRAEWQDDN